MWFIVTMYYVIVGLYYVLNYDTVHPSVKVCLCLVLLELGGTQNFKTVRYCIKYHSINNYHGI